MKRFDLEKALAGDPVCMRDGTPVKVVFFSDLENEEYLVLYVYKEKSASGEEYYWDSWCKKDGKINGGQFVCDLFMAPKKKKVYLKVSKVSSLGGICYFTSHGVTKKNLLSRCDDDEQIVEVEIEVDE